jgi:hypothetical protein
VALGLIMLSMDTPIASQLILAAAHIRAGAVRGVARLPQRPAIPSGQAGLVSSILQLAKKRDIEMRA